MMGFDAILIIGLAGWRYAHCVGSDKIFEWFRFGSVNLMGTFVLKKHQNRKGEPSVRARMFDYYEYGLSCVVYCLSFYGVFLAYAGPSWVAHFGACWAIATLAGVHHELTGTTQNVEDDNIS